MPVDPRWIDDNEDDDAWVLYGEACAEMGLTARPTGRHRKLRQMLDRPDCYNDVSRVQMLTGSLIHRAQHSAGRAFPTDGQHRGVALRSVTRH